MLLNKLQILCHLPYLIQYCFNCCLMLIATQNSFQNKLNKTAVSGADRNITNLNEFHFGRTTFKYFMNLCLPRLEKT
jgi:hypothetical protein